MDRLHAMETFLRVVELGSFTRAAESMRLPKAAVSTRVQQLEAHLGTRLLHRTTRRLRLTDEGAAYLEGARRLLADLAELEGTLAQERAAPRGRLRIDVPAAAGRHLLMPALAGFFERYPGISIEIGSTDRPVDLVQEGVDCVIRGGEVFDESLVARRLGALEVITCASPAYLARRGTPRTPDDLAEHALVLYFSARTGRLYDLDFERDGVERTVGGRHHVAANDADTYIAALIAGHGIGQTPRSAHVDAHLHSGALQRVLPEWSAGTLPLHLLYPRERHVTGRLRAFIEWVVALYAAELATLEASAR